MISPRQDFCTVECTGLLGGIALLRARFVTQSSRPHTHPDLEVGVVVTGSRRVVCRGTAYLAPAGSILVINPGDVHAGTPVDRAGSTYRSFLVPGRVLVGPKCWFPSPIIADPALAHRLVAAHRAIEESAGPRDAEALAGLLDELARRYGAERPARPASSRTAAVEIARSYLERNFASRVRLETVSALAGLTIYQLIRAFRSELGLSPYAYLEQIRVHHAASLLRDGRAISQVAFLTGFSDQSHLTRFFKRVIGVPPGRYRTSALRWKQAAAPRH